MMARLALGAGVLVSACAQLPIQDAAPGHAAPDRLAESICLDEPGSNEVVIVINDNSDVASHAGLFAGPLLSDPSGTYRGTRSEDKAWYGPTLRDYLAFQMKDGPSVRSYRFNLAQADFVNIELRVASAGWTIPLFCAASVQDYLAGIGPFKILESVWWTSPRELGVLLDSIIRGPGKPGRCEMPDGRPC